MDGCLVKQAFYKSRFGIIQLKWSSYKWMFQVPGCCEDYWTIELFQLFKSPPQKRWLPSSKSVRTSARRKSQGQVAMNRLKVKHSPPNPHENRPGPLKGNSSSNHHFSGALLSLRGSETILPCNFEDSKGFREILIIPGSQSLLQYHSKIADRSHDVSPTISPANPQEKIDLPTIQKAAPQVPTMKVPGFSQPRYNTVDRVAPKTSCPTGSLVNAWCFTLAMAQSSRKKQVPKL